MWLKNYPACFPSLHHYKQWVKAAINAKEDASPCDDCNEKYQQSMVNTQRCMPSTVVSVFRVSGRTPKPTAKS